MTIETKDAKAMRDNFRFASLRIKTKKVNGRVYWYGENEVDGLYLKHNPKTSSWARTSKKAAVEILNKYGITAEQFIAYEKGELEIVEVNDEYKPQCDWENPHNYEATGANHARNLYTTETEMATIETKITKNNTNVDTANKNGYIFTTYSTRTGFDSNGYTNDVEKIEIKCDTLGDADNFDGIYRELTFFNEDNKDGWEVKTADGKILAKGNTEADAIKARAIICNADAEVNTATDANEEIINATEIKAATTDVTNAPEVTRFQRGTTYRYYDTNTGEPLWYITIDKRTNTTVTVSGEKFKVFIQPHDRLLNYNKPTESFIRGNYRIDATDACEETADEITPSTLQKFIEAKKEVSYWRNSTGARIWQIAYIRYGVNDGIVGQTPWLNRTMKEADRYLKDEYGMTLLEYLAAEDKWNATDKGAILKDKIERDSKPSVETMPALFPAEDSDDDDELIDPPVDNNTVTDTTPEYKYYIKSRRPIFGAAPNGYIKAVSGEVHEPVRRTNGTYSPKCRIYFATVIYDKPLTDEQILNYDLAVSNETFELLNAPPAQNEMSTISNIAETDGFEEDDDDELIDEPELPPADYFATKLAELKAKQDAAKEKELAAKKVYKEASDKYVECQEATQKFLDAHADKLTEKINTLEIESYITMVRDNGKERYDLFDTSQLNVYAFNGFGKMFIVRCRGNELGTYDTPAQVETVIERLKAAIERGDSEFTFPPIEELAKPEVDKDATADSLTRAMTIALKNYQDFCRVGNLTAAANEWSLYNICRKAMTELRKGEAA